MEDEFITRKDLRVEAQTAQAQANREKLEQAYFEVCPHHRAVSGEVYRAFQEFAGRHPEKHAEIPREAADGQVGPALSEVYYHVRDSVESRLADAVTRRQTVTGREERGSEPTDLDREGALQEEQERYLRSKRGG